jgi:sugar phosphate isomerase/epimerase
MTNFEDFSDFNRHFSNEVKILLDIGHLKVSCQALGLDKIRQLILSNNLISGYHLHDNCGLTDDHLIFELEQAWFLNQLNSDVDFITLEIHDFQDLNLASLTNQLDRVINHGDLI